MLFFQICFVLLMIQAKGNFVDKRHLQSKNLFIKLTVIPSLMLKLVKQQMGAILTYTIIARKTVVIKRIKYNVIL